MEVTIHNADISELNGVSETLQEAADWLVKRGEKLWDANELAPEAIEEQVRRRMFWLARADGEIAGCIRFQTVDMEYWDDVPHLDSAFVHRVAVRRKFAGQGISIAMLDWAKLRAKSLGKRYLRLDCDQREKLCEFYLSQGFEFHSEKVRKPYTVNRYQFEIWKVC